eukprot:TRINITY_DN3633_c0_g1_i7.p1 TRINITY_DN3633_c0_g1~~TRINITY_DN3633_c0_g1_i7.p1  ORF type:complete len:192 (+),score=18.00 TRINITY_DN3633_c0_g1_i7:439-1014(+)
MTVRLWRKSDGHLSRVFEGHTDGVLSVQFSPHDPDEILTGSSDRTVMLWRKSDGQLIRVFEGHTSFVWSVQFSPHDPYEILTGSRDETVMLWRTSDGELIRVFEGHTASVLSVQFSPHDPDEILTGSSDSMTGRCGCGARAMVTSAACSKGTPTVRLWRKSDGQLIRVFEGHTYGALSTRSSSAPTTRTRS